MSFTCHVLPLKAQRTSREEIALTNEHIRMLKKCMSKFRKADPGQREKIVTDAAESIKRV